MKKILFSLITIGLAVYAGTLTARAAVPLGVELRAQGLKINVDDMDKALAFYVDKLGFDVADRSRYPKQVELQTNDRMRLILSYAKKLQSPDANATRVGLTLQVNDLDQAIARLKAAGVDFGEHRKRKEGVGVAIYCNDPFGRAISLMHQTIVKVELFKEPKIYNYGVLVPDMAQAREFYSKKLGFVERTEKYLPLDMPLGHADKTFGFMLHVRPNVNAVKNEYPKALPAFTMLFAAADLVQTAAALRQNGVNILKTAKGDTPAVIFADPFGNISEVIAGQ